MPLTARFFPLLQVLRRHSAPVTAATLAAELKISERTIYRDIAALIAQGIPISGEAGVGYMLRSGFFLPPLMFAEDEIEAILLGLRYVDQRGDAVLRESATNALAKIKTVLPPAARGAMETPVALPGPPGQDFPENKIDLTVLREAIRTRSKLRVDYTNSCGFRGERVVWPIALGFLNEARLLMTWCEARHDFRNLRTDRIARVEKIQERYPERREELLRAWRARMIVWRGKPPLEQLDRASSYIGWSR